MASAEIAGYRELFPLREGMSSDLYRTQLPAAERWVAVKAFRFTLPDESAERRWNHDCQLARSLSAHPGLVAMYDSGVTRDRRPYLTMQLVEGGSVADRMSLSSHGTYSPAEAVRICTAICEALAAGHAAGMIHRFLQPSNILLSPDGTPLLTELGITLFSRRWEAAGYLDEAVPRHTAPEILERDTPGPAADVYSLASVLYTMITGSPPHQDAESSSALLLRVLQHRPPPIEAPGVTPQLNAILANALAAEPTKRPPNASELGNALADILPQLKAQPTRAGGSTDQVQETDPEGEAERDDREVTSQTAGEPPPVPALGLYGYAEPSHEQQTEGDDEAEPEELLVAHETYEPLVGQRDEPGQHLPATRRSDEVVPYPDDVRRWKRRTVIAVGAAVTILLAFLTDNLGSSDNASDASNASEESEEEALPETGGERPATSDVPASDPSTTQVEPSTPSDDDEADDQEPPAPTGLTAQVSEAGVQLQWDESDTVSFAVLVLSETEPPQVMTTSSGPSLFVPATGLEPDAGYCFSVARLDAIASSGTDPTDSDSPLEEGQSDGEDIGPAFSSVSCIRGAAEDTVRTS